MKSSKYKIVVYIIILVFLLFILYIKYHAEYFYVGLGNHYYKHNNINRAIENYEKAFKLGINDSKLRDVYVNSIINSPLTVERQEKLAKIASDEINDTASETAEYFLHNLRREIINKYPNNYIQQATYNGKILHWGRFPITYTIKNIKNIPAEFAEEIDNAFNEWERVSSCRVTFLKENIGSADIEVEFFSDKTENVEYGKKYVTAYTTPDVSQDNLRKMNIKFNILDPEGKLYTRNQIYNTALHEIFHALGLMGHSYEPDDVMFMAKNGYKIIKDERMKISDSDKKTLELLYKIKPDITNENKLQYEYIPYLVLGDTSERNNSKKLEAKNYIYNAPTLPGGYIDLAESLASDGKNVEAIHNLEKALRLAIDNDTKYIIYYNMAVSYYKIEFYDLALDYVNKAFEIKDSEELELLQAEIFLKTKKIKSAIENYSKLVQKYPSNIEYTIALANIYVKKHDYFKARKVIKNYMKNNPKDKKNKRLEPYGILRF